MLNIRRTIPEDFMAVTRLLSVCHLPTPNLHSNDTALFVAKTESHIIGVSGLDVCGQNKGQIRVLAVMPGYRKQNVGRQLVQRVLAEAEHHEIRKLFLLTKTATDYFQSIGFISEDSERPPAGLCQSTTLHDECPLDAQLMSRRVRNLTGARLHYEAANSKFTAVAERAKEHFESGYHCAESVLLAAAEYTGIKSPLLPAIASGFSNGITGNRGYCGALNGGVIAISMVYGQKTPGASVTENITAVRNLINEFNRHHASPMCSELSTCDLDTTDNKHDNRDNLLKNHCKEFIATAARIAASLLDKRR